MNEGESFHGVDPSLHGQAVQRPQDTQNERATITAPFATPDDVAEVHDIPDERRDELLELLDSVQVEPGPNAEGLAAQGEPAFDYESVPFVSPESRTSDLKPEHIPVIEAAVDRVVKARAARLKNDQKRDKRSRVAKKK